mmetsp:Transcript_75/g.246  ORF Transcript_75/g.246 Transcript_75/m.246 type:complete len:479 (-) Transcript_75:172-1608(-)
MWSATSSKAAPLRAATVALWPWAVCVRATRGRQAARTAAPRVGCERGSQSASASSITGAMSPGTSCARPNMANSSARSSARRSRSASRSSSAAMFAAELSRRARRASMSTKRSSWCFPDTTRCSKASSSPRSTSRWSASPRWRWSKVRIFDSAMSTQREMLCRSSCPRGRLRGSRSSSAAPSSSPPPLVPMSSRPERTLVCGPRMSTTTTFGGADPGPSPPSLPSSLPASPVPRRTWSAVMKRVRSVFGAPAPLRQRPSWAACSAGESCHRRREPPLPPPPRSSWSSSSTVSPRSSRSMMRFALRLVCSLTDPRPSRPRGPATSTLREMPRPSLPSPPPLQPSFMSIFIPNPLVCFSNWKFFGFATRRGGGGCASVPLPLVAVEDASSRRLPAPPAFRSCRNSLLDSMEGAGAASPAGAAPAPLAAAGGAVDAAVALGRVEDTNAMGRAPVDDELASSRRRFFRGPPGSRRRSASASS